MLLQKLEDDNVLVYYGVSLSKTTLFNLFYTCPWWVSTHSPLGSSHKGCFLPALSKSVCLVPSLSVCSHGFLISYQFFLAPAIFTSGPDLYRNINPTNYFLFFLLLCPSSRLSSVSLWNFYFTLLVFQWEKGGFVLGFFVCFLYRE